MFLLGLYNGLMAFFLRSFDPTSPLVSSRYEVNPSLVPELEAKGMQFVGRDETGERMEILELSDNPPDHPFFVAAQFHPEFKSRWAAGGRKARARERGG